MLTSLDLELFKIKERYGLPEKIRFLLLDYEDLNFYHYGVIGPRFTWTDADFDNAANHLTALRDSSVVPDLIAPLAERCSERCLGTNASDWEGLLRALSTPKNFSMLLRKTKPHARPNLIRNLATLLHIVPQSCLVGVISQPFRQYCLDSQFDTARIGDEAPWESTESTLGLLRPLEYFFEIGSEGSRKATLHFLRSSASTIPVGLCLNFSEIDLQEVVRLEAERVLEALHVERLAAAVQQAEGTDSLFGSLGVNLHRALPLHSAFCWKLVNGRLQLSQAIGLPLRPRSIAAVSVLAERRSLKLTGDTLQFLQANATRHLGSKGFKVDPASISPYGKVFSVPLPLWDFNGQVSCHPLDPTHCISLLSEKQDLLLQLLIPAHAKANLQQLAQNLATILRALDSRSMVGSSSGRFPRANLKLPDESWIYHPDTANAVRTQVAFLHRAWAGDPTRRERVGILFHGAHGAGKSHLAKWLAKDIVGDPKPKIVQSADIKNKFMGETERALKNLVSMLCTLDSRVVIINEVEQLAWRGQDEPLNAHTRAAFKAALDDYKDFLSANTSARSLLICTTNYIEDIESAIADRFYQVDFLWKEQQIRDLVDRLTANSCWTSDARETLLSLAVLRSLSGRSVAGSVAEIEKYAEDRRDGFPAAVLEISEADVRMVLGSERARGTGGNKSGGRIPAVEIEDFCAWLEGILERARQEQWTNNSALFQAVGINANHISFIVTRFPAWAREFAKIKTSNRRKRADLVMPVE